MVDLSWLGCLVTAAIDNEPPARLLEWCEPHYSPYYHLLHLLALESDTEGVCVELGIEKARGSLAMLMGGREVYGFDHTHRLEVDIIRRDYPETFHYYEQSSLPVPGWWDKKVAILHVDTEHSFAQAREEYNQWKPWLVPGAVVCFDDTFAMESDVGRFVATLHYPTIFDSRLHSCGYAAMIYGGG